MEINEMVFAIENYESETEMWNDIGAFLKLLMKNDYVATVRDDDIDIIIIEYEHDESKEAWGCPNPYWITEDEYWDIKADEDDTFSTAETDYSTISTKDYPSTYTVTANNNKDKYEYINENCFKCSRENNS